MPIYEYRCSKCGDFEAMQRITDQPLKRCPTCKSKVSKLVSSTAFQLKGTGWYATDYARKEKGAEGKKAEDAGAPKVAEGSDSKSEAKASPEPSKKPGKGESAAA